MTFSKPPEWGKRFVFPENIQIEYNGYMGSLTSEIAVKMAERYEDAVVKQIAMEGVKKPKECRFTLTADTITLLDAIEVIPTTAEAEANIKAVPVWKM